MVLRPPQRSVFLRGRDGVPHLLREHCLFTPCARYSQPPMERTADRAFHAELAGSPLFYSPLTFCFSFPPNQVKLSISSLSWSIPPPPAPGPPLFFFENGLKSLTSHGVFEPSRVALGLLSLFPRPPHSLLESSIPLFFPRLFDIAVCLLEPTKPLVLVSFPSCHGGWPLMGGRSRCRRGALPRGGFFFPITMPTRLFPFIIAWNAACFFPCSSLFLLCP